MRSAPSDPQPAAQPAVLSRGGKRGGKENAPPGGRRADPSPDARAVAIQAISDEAALRNRLAGEIHDGPVQSLSALTTRLQVVELHAARGDLEKVKELLAQLRSEINAEVSRIRQMIADLAGGDADERGRGQRC
jgi:signal transduction histidine kinase